MNRCPFEDEDTVVMSLEERARLLEEVNRLDDEEERAAERSDRKHS